MCGICGFTWDNKKLICQMAKEIAHRGPDQKGFFIDKHISLGHVRLSIIDVSAQGRQPMWNEDHSICVIFNGEIYNFKKLRVFLEMKGHRFSSATDTEVIPHLYEEFGNGFVQYLQGMFALALWDSPQQKLLLARDRIGIKPLYYAVTKNDLVFASEIKAILQADIIRQVNSDALSDLLSYRFIPGPKTLFKGITKLQPGHILTHQHGKITVKRYWSLVMKPEHITADVARQHLHDVLTESVQRMMVSDVPVGMFLSGGIDSGTIVSLMSKLQTNPVKTFSISFDGKSEDIRTAEELAAEFSTDHQTIDVTSDTLSHLPKIIWHSDEPIADPALIPTYILSRHAKKKVSVVLTGDGADELFAGYEHYKIMKLSQPLRYLPSFVRKNVLPAALSMVPSRKLDTLFEYSSALGEEGLQRASHFLADREDNKKSFMHLLEVFTEKEKQELSYDKIPPSKQDALSIPAKTSDLVNSMCRADTTVTLPDDYLMKIDKMAMAWGVEGRVPFLDEKIVDFSTRLPSSLKLHGMTEKYILRKAMENDLPPSVAWRRKRRFFVPIDDWFLKDIRQTGENMLNPEIMNTYFDKRYISKIFERYSQSKLYYGRQFWILANFSLWHSLFIDEDKQLLKKGL